MKEFHEDYAKEILKRITKKEVRDYSTYDFGREKDERNKSVIVREKDAYRYLELIRQEIFFGQIAFVGTGRWLGEENHNGVELVVGQGNDQFDILRLARTDAINYGMKTEDLVKPLQTYHQLYGINVYSAQTDVVAFELLNLPNDLPSFAQQLYEFCPDIIDQGFESIFNLVKNIEKTHKIILWWD